MSYTIEAVEAAGLDVPAYVSTDDEFIASIARESQAVGVLLRPEELANDTATTESVLIHALESLTKQECIPEWIMTLPPTSPFRQADTIRNFVNIARNCSKNVDCIMSVTETRGDFWQMHPHGYMQRLFSQAPRRQQDRQPLFEENSAIYLTRTRALRETKSILGRAVMGVPINKIEAFDINEPEDINLAEYLFSYAASIKK